MKTVLESYRARGLTVVEFCSDVGGSRWSASEMASGEWKVDAVCAGSVYRWGIYSKESSARAAAANLNKLADLYRAQKKRS